MVETQRLLQQKPGQTLEFLPDPHPELIAETLTSFANSEGGTLVLGINEEGYMGGIFVEEDASDALEGALRLCNPPVHTDWQAEEMPGGVLILLRVERSDTLHALTDGRILTRKGRKNVPTDGQQLEVMLANRPTGDFEMQVVPGAQRDDLDPEVIEEYLERRQKRSPRSTVMPTDKLLQQIGALNDKMEPTISGLLLFGKDPQLFMPQSRAIFVKFADVQPRGPEGSFGYGRREEITGPLARIVERAWRVVWEEMDKQSVVRGLHRDEETEYPTFAVREALVNAVAHRDYRLNGRSIEIRMYTDRLEITSPGGLPAHITIDNIVEEHYSRNPRLVNGLYQWGYIEELGLGVDRMIEDMMAMGHQPPTFEAKSHRFTVILYNRRETVQAVPKWESNMNERQMKALQYMKEHKSINNRQYREICPNVGAETLRLDMVDLVNKGIILKIGEKRGTRYILK
ncbi:MAG: ATP-binding protein [Chloroflexota bacterium]